MNPRWPWIAGGRRAVRVLALALLVLLAACCPCRGATEEDRLARVHGRITDVAGAPVAGAMVFAYRGEDVKRPVDFQSPATDGAGTYVLEVPAGRYWLVARQRRGPGPVTGPLGPNDRHSGPAVVVRLRPGSDKRLDFVVASLREAVQRREKQRPDLVRLQGTVVDRQGRPLAGRYVVASPRRVAGTMPEYLSLTTGNDGRFTLFVRQGVVHLGVASIFPPDPEQPLEDRLDVSDGRDRHGIVLCPRP